MTRRMGMDNMSGDPRKKLVWDTIVSLYSSAVSAAESVLSKNSDVHFYHRAEGWNEIDRNWYGNEMNAGELFRWIYDESITDEEYEGDPRLPYAYTDAEIKKMKTSKTEYDIARWRKSIEVHMESVRKYEKMIAAATKEDTKEDVEMETKEDADDANRQG